MRVRWWSSFEVEAITTSPTGARWLVCIDIQPNRTTQAVERADVMNVGGFSDTVFGAVAVFAAGAMDADHWVGEIEKIALDPQ